MSTIALVLSLAMVATETPEGPWSTAGLYDAICLPVSAAGEELTRAQGRGRAFMIRARIDTARGPVEVEPWPVYALLDAEMVGNPGFTFSPDLAESTAESRGGMPFPSFVLTQRLDEERQQIILITAGIQGRAFFVVNQVPGWPSTIMMGTCTVRETPASAQTGETGP